MPGIIRYGKFTIGWAAPIQRRRIGVLRGEAHDSAEARTGKNYIGLLHEETEQQRAADILAATKHRIMRQIFARMPAMFSRRGEAR